jgi:hypothetical protein
MHTVYYIRNIKTHHIYIGVTKEPLKRRIAQHYYKLRKGVHTNNALQQAWDADGVESFLYGAIVRIPSRETIPARFRPTVEEERWIQVYKSDDPRYGYNQSYKIKSIL